ncbi:unnamed protein product [Larinioides sclopetarius]|uniref:Uncharacterized protein n=1 Tax=Larinioides sclopetarius TaxID=280406 RepID=A0AAV2AS07_9ARAC
MGCINTRPAVQRKNIEKKDIQDYIKQIHENYESSRDRFPEDHQNPLSSLERWTEKERKLARLREEKAHLAELANIEKEAAERAAIARREKFAAAETSITKLRETTTYAAGLGQRGKPRKRRTARRVEAVANVRQMCSCRMQSKITNATLQRSSFSSNLDVHGGIPELLRAQPYLDVHQQLCPVQEDLRGFLRGPALR